MKSIKSLVKVISCEVAAFDVEFNQGMTVILDFAFRRRLWFSITPIDKALDQIMVKCPRF